MTQSDVAATLKTLSKKDLIWIVTEMDSRSFTHSLCSVLLDLEARNARRRMEEANAQFALYVEKMKQYEDLVDMALTQGVDNVPPNTLTRASALGREALAARDRWKKLSGI